MVLYTVVPPEVLFEDDHRGADATGPGQPGGGLLLDPADVFLGFHGGVPVWAQARWVGGRWELVRLITTDPGLYLQPALAPGCRLPL